MTVCAVDATLADRCPSALLERAFSIAELCYLMMSKSQDPGDAMEEASVGGYGAREAWRREKVGVDAQDDLTGRGRDLVYALHRDAVYRACR